MLVYKPDIYYLDSAATTAVTTTTSATDLHQIESLKAENDRLKGTTISKPFFILAATSAGEW